MKTKVRPVLQALDLNQRYTVDEAIAYLRTSRQTFYNLVNAPNGLRVIKEGRRTFVPGVELARISRPPASPV